MASDDTTTRRRAIRILEDGHSAVGELLDSLPARALSRPGLGGGTWSPKDLVGHLESWEEYAIEALDAWDQGMGVPIDRELWSKGTSVVNAEAVARKASRSAARMLRHAERTHSELIRRLEATSDARWRAPGTPRARRPVGARLGSILGGPTGDFMHAEAHLKDLRAFVAEHGRS
jgi:hypothetical protein